MTEDTTPRELAVERMRDALRMAAQGLSDARRHLMELPGDTFCDSRPLDDHLNEALILVRDVRSDLEDVA